jgi:RNA polymerase sigma-54 factor
MRIDASQQLRMEQRMKLSPRMIQSMEILQLPALALEDRIEQEMEANPVLELREPEATEQELLAQREENAKANAAEQPLVVGETQKEAAADYERLADFSEQYGDSWEQNVSESAEYHTPMRRDDGERDSKMDAMANTMARSASLAEQLQDQWRFVETDPDLRRAGEHLIGFVDDDGYIRTEPEQIIKQAPAGVTQEQLDEALRIMQERLEPAGIASRNLQECLLNQINALIREEGEEEDLVAARTLVQDYLKDIEMNRLPRIARASGLTLDQINAGLHRLRRLDPRPGRRLAPERPQTIMPDVLVEYDPVHDRYIAGLNRGRQPMLRINPRYRELAADKAQEKSTRQYLAQNMNNARWLIDALRQRNNTLLRVVNVVLEAQRDFLDHGPQHLKPLPMILVADQLGIHVGTVSRAVAEKYMQTPRGIFPLRMFFSGGTESSSGEEMSWAAVQAKLKEIIDKEDSGNPWSDDQLVEQLKAQGIEIARRTVAKYRQQMNIPPARRRKKF